ncbi:MAG TPA: SoxR reducing system RseC family protein [Gallionella sp.]
MLETRAVVVRVEGKTTLVRADQGNGCGQCSGKGCGTGKLSQLFCSEPRQFQVENPINAQVGDEVIVSVVQGSVLRGITLLYGLPLFLLMVFASIGATIGEPQGHADRYAALGSAVGLAVGFVLAWLISSRQGQKHAKPYITRIGQE